MIVSVGNTTGIVGKATLAVQLALARAVPRAQVWRQAGKYDGVVIDAGGRAALALSDLLIVPFLPRSADVWARADIAALIDEANGVRDGLRAYAVLNAADPGVSSNNTDAAVAMADFPGLPCSTPGSGGAKRSPTRLALSCRSRNRRRAIPGRARNRPLSFPPCSAMRLISKSVKVR